MSTALHLDNMTTDDPLEGGQEVHPEYDTDDLFGCDCSDGSCEYPLGLLISPQENKDRLRLCLAAIDGKRTPDSTDGDIERASVVRGIRCHYNFATSQAVTELCTCDPSPRFIRARNARLIMSNEIPESDQMNHRYLPYCIWYPDFVTEETYRQLAIRYPEMRYQVGRACAAAGLASLYHELDLLPDVSIAEEARESGTEGGSLIYTSIMAAPFRYAVMNDYTLSVNVKNPRFPALLNGDTDVRWRLDYRIGLHSPGFSTRLDVSPCIEEDQRIGKQTIRMIREHSHLTHDEIKLLSEPLGDLPTMKKTLLIQMAAYEGNIDRYARLFRPNSMPEVELICVIRGIYHHTTFANWWANQIQQNSSRIQILRFTSCLDDVKRAISARRIMINDTQEFHKGWKSGSPQPFVIWWPLKPNTETLRALAQRVPSMKEQAAIACIYCDYQFEYIAVKATPTALLWLAAKQSPNPFYLADIERKAAEQGIQVDDDSEPFADYSCVDSDLESTDAGFKTSVPDGMQRRYYGPYHHGGVWVSLIDMRIFASLELVRKLDRFTNGNSFGDTAETENWVLPDSSA